MATSEDIVHLSKRATAPKDFLEWVFAAENAIEEVTLVAESLRLRLVEWEVLLVVEGEVWAKPEGILLCSPLLLLTLVLLLLPLALSKLLLFLFTS